MNETGGGEPKQHFEVAQPTAGEETTSEFSEQDKSASESTVGKQATPTAILPLPPVPVVPTAPISPVQDDSQTTVSPPATAKLPAADSDRLEKQWVEKAKAIVAETRNDPYKQKNEMSKIKADYIQKRYNKVIKTDDAVAA